MISNHLDLIKYLCNIYKLGSIDNSNNQIVSALLNDNIYPNIKKKDVLNKYIWTKNEYIEVFYYLNAILNKITEKKDYDDIELINNTYILNIYNIINDIYYNHLEYIFASTENFNNILIDSISKQEDQHFIKFLIDDLKKIPRYKLNDENCYIYLDKENKSSLVDNQLSPSLNLKYLIKQEQQSSLLNENVLLCPSLYNICMLAIDSELAISEDVLNQIFEFEIDMPNNNTLKSTESILLWVVLSKKHVGILMQKAELRSKINENSVNHIFEYGKYKDLSFLHIYLSKIYHSFILKKYGDGHIHRMDVQSLITIDDNKILKKINKISLNHMVVNGNNKGESLLLYICMKHIELLSIENYRLLNLINPVVFNTRRITNKLPSHNESPALYTSETNLGRKMIKINNHKLFNEIDKDTLNAIHNLYSINSILHNIARDPECHELFIENNYSLVDKIDEYTFIYYDNDIDNESLALIFSKDKNKYPLFYAQDFRLYKILLNNPAAFNNYSENGESIAYYFSKYKEGRELLKKDDFALMKLITENTFTKKVYTEETNILRILRNERVNRNYSSIERVLSETEDGIILLLANNHGFYNMMSKECLSLKTGPTIQEVISKKINDNKRKLDDVNSNNIYENSENKTISSNKKLKR